MSWVAKRHSGPGMGVGGMFVELQVLSGLPEMLAARPPRLLWLPDQCWHAARALGAGSSPISAELPLHPIAQLRGNMRAVLAARPLVGGEDWLPLVWQTDHGEWKSSIDWSAVQRAIVREEYHPGLTPTLEMRLPFNYSRLPNWFKGWARSLRKGALEKPVELEFPETESISPTIADPSGRALTVPVPCADWVSNLMQLLENKVADEANGPWPPGYTSALCITHDVDTDWLFRQDGWLDRLLELEAANGLSGAWYCVPEYCRSAMAKRGMEKIRAAGAELGCHGYNHDARWPLLRGAAFRKRWLRVRSFSEDWGLRGFRSEWLYRTPAFLDAIGEIFQYDTSIPTLGRGYTTGTRNGCGTFLPYRLRNVLEIPVTLPMDEERHALGESVPCFWQRQYERAQAVASRSGLIMLVLHPQAHQSANPVSFQALQTWLPRIASLPGVWKAQPAEILARSLGRVLEPVT